MTTTFADLTTMRVGGPIGRLVTPTTTADLIDTVRESDSARDPLLVMSGGSNLVVGDAGWDGTVVRVSSADLAIDGDLLTASAGAEWDRVVHTSLAEGLAGLEALSGIPGSVGGTPVQNVGAYGTTTSDLLESLSVYDRQTAEVERWPAERCGFGRHRDSVFKHSDRWVVLDVTFRLQRSAQSRPVAYDELAARLGIDVGGTAPAADVRRTVLDLRRGKGMVLDADDHDTWSVGSFFLNPVVVEVPPQAKECRQYADANGTKLSAAWLIQHAGFPPGYGRDWRNGAVTLSSRHTLALTNRGGAMTSDVMAFAAHIRDGVQNCFGVGLSPECDLINCSF